MMLRLRWGACLSGPSSRFRSLRGWTGSGRQDSRFLRLGLFCLGRRSFSAQAALDGFEQAFHREWFADVVDDAEVLGIGLVPAALVGGDHDDRRGVGLALEVFE